MCRSRPIKLQLPFTPVPRLKLQRHGAGRSLLAACEQVLDQTVAYCLPYTHLTGFYGRAGFRPADASELPGFLQQRLATYLADGQDVLAMVRAPALDLPQGLSAPTT